MAKANQEWIFLEFVLWGAMAGMKSHIAPRVGFSPHTKLICGGGLFGLTAVGSYMVLFGSGSPRARVPRALGNQPRPSRPKPCGKRVAIRFCA